MEMLEEIREDKQESPNNSEGRRTRRREADDHAKKAKQHTKELER